MSSSYIKYAFNDCRNDPLLRFKYAFQEGIAKPRCLALDQKQQVIHAKIKKQSLSLILEKSTKQLLELITFKKAEIRPLKGLLQDLKLLEARYSKRTGRLSWQFNRFLFSILAALKICKLNPLVKHQNETHLALLKFEAKIKELLGKCENIEQLTVSAKPSIAHNNSASSQPSHSLNTPSPSSSPPVRLASPPQVESKLSEAELEKWKEIESVLNRSLVNNHARSCLRFACELADDLLHSTKRDLLPASLAKEYGVSSLEEKNKEKIVKYIDGQLHWIPVKEKKMSVFSRGAQQEVEIGKPEESALIFDFPLKRIILLSDGLQQSLVLEKLLSTIKKDKVPTEIRGFKTLTLEASSAAFMNVLPWLESYEPIEIDCRKCADLSADQLMALTKSFPVIRKLDLRGTKISWQDLTIDLLIYFPYLEHLQLDPIHNPLDEENLKKWMAQTALFDCTLQLGEKQELVEVAYDKEIQARNLPFDKPFTDFMQKLPAYISEETKALISKLIKKQAREPVKTYAVADQLMHIFREGVLQASKAPMVLEECKSVIWQGFTNEQSQIQSNLSQLDLQALGHLQLALKKASQTPRELDDIEQWLQNNGMIKIYINCLDLYPDLCRVIETLVDEIYEDKLKGI